MNKEAKDDDRGNEYLGSSQVDGRSSKIDIRHRVRREIANRVDDGKYCIAYKGTIYNMGEKNVKGISALPHRATRGEHV